MASGNRPSTVPKYGSSIAVASMGNGMLAQYYSNDTRVMTGGANAQLSGGTLNGLAHRLADGRAGDLQDYEDAAYIRRTLFNSN